MREVRTVPILSENFFRADQQYGTVNFLQQANGFGNTVRHAGAGSNNVTRVMGLQQTSSPESQVATDGMSRVLVQLQTARRKFGGRRPDLGEGISGGEQGHFLRPSSV